MSLFRSPTNQPTNPPPSFPYLTRLLSALLQQTKEGSENIKTSVGDEISGGCSVESLGFGLRCALAQTFAWSTKYQCCWQCLYLVIALTALGPDF